MNVLLSMRTRKHDTYDEDQSAISQDWIEFCEKWQFTPILVPNHTKLIHGLLSLNPKAIILSGGSDDVFIQSVRNQTERNLIQFGIENKLPILAVCRGFQFVNIYFGGSIEQNMPAFHDGHGHEVVIKDPKPNELTEKYQVNSYHADGVSHNGLSQDFDVIAHDDHGYVEAYKHKQYPIWGVQWHPERNNLKGEVLDKHIINQWIKACV